MNDLEKAKKLAEIDKYEHELASLEEINNALFPLSQLLALKIMNITNKIDMCKRLLKDVESKDD